MRDSKSARVLDFFLKNADANGWNSLSDAYGVLREKFPDTTTQLIYNVKVKADKALKAQRRGGPQPETFDQAESPVTMTVANGEALTSPELKTMHPKIRKKVVLLMGQRDDLLKDNTNLRAATNGKKRKVTRLYQGIKEASSSRKAVDILVDGLLQKKPPRKVLREAVLVAIGMED